MSQVGQGHYYVDCGGRIFKQSAEQLSDVTERERLAQEAVRESQDPGRDVDHVSDEPDLPQQPSQPSEQENNVALVSQPDVSMRDPGPPTRRWKQLYQWLQLQGNPLLLQSRSATPNGHASTK